ncbi:hypothetical protein [Nocardia sp. BMG111209]|uniref:hypothetical protein n=1 Tax=Nocardia sp. BMG111209 TaxID=1160137 RepID=UPI00037AC207|nr:hypothetical protein [Nocardia sp. BMG111209]
MAHWFGRAVSALVISAIPVAAAFGATGIATADSDGLGTRPIPDAGVLAPLDPAVVHAPDPAGVPAVLPIQAPEGSVRIGSAQVARPDWLDPQQADAVNIGAAQTEANLAQTLNAAGLPASRSDRIAADTLGSAATGAVIGAAASSPIAVVGALIGTASGLLAGIPFAPAGLVFVPVLGASLAAGMILGTAAAAGAALGAVAGAIEGAAAPATVDAEPAVVPAAS